jgi:Xaa-Pro aminopeptidase
MPNDWNAVRYELDRSENFSEIYNSPYYTDTVYDKFSDAEYERRYALARERMRQEKLDALILPGGANNRSHGAGVKWTSGLYDRRAISQYVVLPLEGDPMLVYSHPGIHMEATRQAVSIKDVRGARGGKFGLVIAERLEELGLQEGRIGVTVLDRSGPEYMGLMCYRQIVERLPNLELVFLPDLLHEMMTIKSDEEIEAIKDSGRLMVTCLEAVKEAAKPGAYEYQLEAAATYAILNNGGQVHFLIIGSTSMHDSRMIFPNPFPSKRILTEGDIILTEITGGYKGYTAKIGHPISIGQPTEAYNTFYRNVVVPGYKAIEEQFIPGNTLKDVQKAGSLFREKGEQSRPILAHGIDLITSSPYISTDEIKGASADDVIQPGMVFSIEITPVKADGSFGIFLSRTYVITEQGHVDMTPYPLDDIIVIPA